MIRFRARPRFQRWREIINYREQKSHLTTGRFFAAPLLLPDKITSYTDYVLNLDKLTVFVSEHKLHHMGSGNPVGLWVGKFVSFVLILPYSVVKSNKEHNTYARQVYEYICSFTSTYA